MNGFPRLQSAPRLVPKRLPESLRIGKYTATPSQQSQTPQFEETFATIARSVIAIAVGTTNDGAPNIVGTGFALEFSEFFATCWHVASYHDELIKKSKSELQNLGLMANKLRIALRSSDSYIWREIEAKTWLRGQNKEHDVCIYRIIGVAVPPLRLAQGNPLVLGAEVGLTGFPMGSLLQGDVIRPYVIKTNIAGGLEWPVSETAKSPRIALGTAVARGFSGGPVFSVSDGAVVGMVASKMMEGDEDGSRWPSGISLAVMPDLLRQMLQTGVQQTTRTIKSAQASHLP